MLLSVSGDWDTFAVQGGSRELAGDSVLGRPLWDFIGGDEVRHLFRILLSRVRETGRPVTVPFRCDAPELRRWQTLTFRPVPDVERGIDVVVRNVAEEGRPAVPLLDPTVSRSEEHLVVCAWCRRTRLDEEEWAEVEVAAERLGLFGATDLPAISHGICPDCRGVVEDAAASLG